MPVRIYRGAEKGWVNAVVKADGDKTERSLDDFEQSMGRAVGAAPLNSAKNNKNAVTRADGTDLERWVNVCVREEKPGAEIEWVPSSSVKIPEEHILELQRRQEEDERAAAERKAEQEALENAAAAPEEEQAGFMSAWRGIFGGGGGS
jgi:hypothetical protein